MRVDDRSLRQFAASDIWKDMQDYINDMIKIEQSGMEVCGPGTGTTALEFPYRMVAYQSSIEKLRDMLELPSLLLESLKEPLENDEEPVKHHGEED